MNKSSPINETTSVITTRCVLHKLSVAPVLMLILCSLITSCGTDTGAGAIGLFTVTARNDTQDLTFVTAGTNPDVVVPVIVNDTIQIMTGLDYPGYLGANGDFGGNSGHPFNYDNTVTPWDPDSGLSMNINGGNPHFPLAGFPDAPDMGGVLTDNRATVGFNDPNLIEITYAPNQDTHGVDWFAYTPYGINGGVDTAYVIVRFVMITEDDYEPDDFMQFARDITPYVTKTIGENYTESHNSDYPNLDSRPATSYRTAASGDNFSIRGDRDWFLIRLPTNRPDYAIEIKTILPKTLLYSNRDQAGSVNDLGVVLIEEQTGRPPQRANNGPILYRYTQNMDVALPFLPYSSVLPGFVAGTGAGLNNKNHLFQNERQNFEPGNPSPLWFKWPLDTASNFLPGSPIPSTGRVFIRVNPTASINPGGIAPIYFMGDYRIDFKLLYKEYPFP